MKQYLEKFLLFLNKRHGITPDILTYVRIFSAPWLALLISKVISSKSLTFAIITLAIYFLVVATDFLDGILARALPKEKKHNYAHGGMLDRMSDKILIVFLLIPFGLNLFTFLIISAESILAFHAIFALDDEKAAGQVGKIKMILETFLIPILILMRLTTFIPDFIFYIYIIITIFYTYFSVYSHYSDYFYFEK